MQLKFKEKAFLNGRSRFLLFLLFFFLSFLIKEKISFAGESTQIFGEFVNGDDFRIQNCNAFLGAYATSSVNVYTPRPQDVAPYNPSNWPSYTLANINQNSATNACTAIAGLGVDNFLNLWSSPANGTTYFFFWASNEPIGYTIVNYNSGGSNTPSGTNTVQSRIDTFTYATSTGLANVTGYWQTHTDSREVLSFWQQSQNTGQESFKEYTATSTGLFNFTFPFLGLPTPWTGATTTQPILTSFTLNARLEQRFNDFNPFSGTGTPPSILDATSTLVTTLTYGLPDFSTGAGIFELPEYECSLSSITGCIKNAFLWLFYPASDSIQKFTTIPYEAKFPFVYVYQIQSIRNSLFSASSTAPTSVTVPLWKIGDAATSTITLLSKDMIEDVPFSSTIFFILTALIWFGMAEYIYYRVIRTHDTNTPS